jgi:hypothetical protein
MRVLFGIVVVLCCLDFCQCAKNDTKEKSDAGEPDAAGDAAIVQPVDARPFCESRVPSTCTPVASDGNVCPASKCFGDPNVGVICECIAWLCNASADECTSSGFHAPFEGTWHCSWSPDQYKCTQPKGGTGPVAGHNPDWICSYLPGEGSWECVFTYVPNPCNTPSGASSWTCAPGPEPDELTCWLRCAS